MGMAALYWPCSGAIQVQPVTPEHAKRRTTTVCQRTMLPDPPCRHSQLLIAKDAAYQMMRKACSTLGLGEEDPGLDGGEVRNGNAMVLDPYGEVLSECHALGADVCVAMCTESKLGLAGGRRYLRARRPDLYWPLTEGDAGATLPGWQRQAPADISEQAEEAAGAMPSRLGDPRVLRAAQVLYDFLRMKASARSVHQARASRSPPLPPASTCPHPPAVHPWRARK